MIFFDISSLARWSGPPVGILRVQQKLAEYARRHLPEVVFTIFDTDMDCWREIRPEWVDHIISGAASVDMSLMPDPSRSSRRIQERLGPRFRNAFYWVVQSRRKALDRLEGIRLTAKSKGLRDKADALIERLLSPKHRQRFYDADGNRRMLPPFSMVAGSPVRPGPEDVTLAVQFDWSHTNIRAIAALKEKLKFRHIVLCYDIIPIMFPQWYSARDVNSFTEYYNRVLPIADRIIFNSRRIRDDVTRYAATLGVTLPDTRLATLGSDPIQFANVETPPPSELTPGKYILYVSTVEPRKNHQMLCDVWERLLADGVPQKSGFKLVFVGRRGWMMEDFFSKFSSKDWAGSVLHYTYVDDALLLTLYRHAAFCVYPSFYEGYGLPPAEALQHGKPLLASNGGAIPEVVGDFGTCLDPCDTNGWEKHIREWMENPAQMKRVDAACSRSRSLTWEQAGAAFFACVH